MSLVKRNDPFTWDPFREMEELTSRLSRLFSREQTGWPLADWEPRVNIHENPEQYEVSAELPQVKREDVKLSLENGVLSLSGERRYEKRQADGARVHRLESAYGHFMRTFALPDDADPDRIDAHFADGMLTVKVGRKARTTTPKGRMIAVR